MMLQHGPCDNNTLWAHIVIVLIQSVQFVLVAWLTNRARGKDKAERAAKENGLNGH